MRFRELLCYLILAVGPPLYLIGIPYRYFHNKQLYAATVIDSEEALHKVDWSARPLVRLDAKSGPTLPNVESGSDLQVRKVYDNVGVVIRFPGGSLHSRTPIWGYACPVPDVMRALGGDGRRPSLVGLIEPVQSPTPVSPFEPIVALILILTLSPWAWKRVRGKLGNDQGEEFP